MYMPFFNILTKNALFFKTPFGGKNRKLCNFAKCTISTNSITEKVDPRQNKQLKLEQIGRLNNVILSVQAEEALNKSASLSIYRLPNNSSFMLTGDVREEDNFRKVLYFKWKARKSYKKRVMNLPSTKSRRRYAQKNR
ncbi:conserved Plasmodium protein, unknown function [Plasmodium knowlesi strain H]|uniref:Uncharacterized protein n=3 Tax=Plasmodium knowlesi TaxID=5850 RepID=A0A5K1UFK0_PLAKH|nr:conserved Plasmodium protein, unknown function [Plasmodium knowlesi strain H]OTN63845.1 Uncharacterized protein PKNOH_S140223400 [Plasmodium knowlesi]CAA9990662.1 conserved Plasmodium protein, unknown function [Plasmodium knowlesi strain H]SBO25966.1 conserved Plasmodium protein, unknown function [Plasmodium knowlesi strain H]SBO28696.1 conserved Plasmodium protein, unknown function [Plasmodium knowlesi strain H]VVS80136.1 conserved Plasmodium protein, unknown function [Plasmodium knowlesi |eukprot:XP_002261953.1 hypothetical protein, conserved in Plasmodium species [Plasmodium knowlesi strain H]